jgi:hypothetical protein
MAKLNVQIIQQALQKITSSEKLVSDLTPDEIEQITSYSESLTSKTALKEVQITSQLGGFIDTTEGRKRQADYLEWLNSRPHPEEITELTQLKPLACSPFLVNTLLERAVDESFFQISMGKVGDNLTFLLAIVDKSGTIVTNSLPVADDEPQALGGGDDGYLDDMRPCPPCE